MSKVVLLVHDFGPRRVDAYSLLRDKLGLGISHINHAHSTGVPLIERTLFDRGDKKFPADLLDLLTGLDALEVKYSTFELPGNQVFSPAAKYYEITAERLGNMIRARQASLDHQRGLGELEDGSST